LAKPEPCLQDFLNVKQTSACLPEQLQQLVLLSQKKRVPRGILTDKFSVVAMKLCYVSFLYILGILRRNLPVKRQQLFFSHNCICFREQTDVGLKFITVFVNPIGIW